ncbi:MAG: hypothetical protein QOG75_3481, partial [Mycobacterium sp.]|nr:hypothetical protein [Mycobacterium sp.]
QAQGYVAHSQADDHLRIHGGNGGRLHFKYHGSLLASGIRPHHSFSFSQVGSKRRSNMYVPA